MAFNKGKGKTTKFEYTPRSENEVRARATSGGSREGFLADGVKTFSPKQGQHTVRILPPTWNGAKHYGIDLYAHYNIGPDGNAYLCLAKMKSGFCAICAERTRAIKEEDEELEQALKPRQRVGCWVIDRDNERDGPLFWSMPWTLDREIVQQSIDKKTGVVYPLDSPTEGYDVSFERQGEGTTTKYVGVQLDRRDSPLSDDDDTAAEWLEFIKENPVLDQLVFQEEDYLEDMVGKGLGAPRAARGKGKDKEKDKGKEKERSKRANGKDDEDEDKEKDDDKDARRSKSTKKAKAKEYDLDELTWEEVHELDEDELTALAEQADVDIDDAGDEEEAADLICAELKIKKPKAEREEKESKAEKSDKPTMRSRLGSLRDKDRKSKD